jgi:hypothetical protein
MSHHDRDHARELTAVILECQALMGEAGLNPTVTDLVEMSRLVWMREAEARRMEFVAGERWLRERTVN